MKHVGHVDAEHDDRDDKDEDDNNENETWEAIVTGNKTVTFHFDQQVITFKSGTSTFTLTVPDAMITFDPAATVATTTFQDGMWVTRAPIPARGLSGASSPRVSPGRRRAR